MLVNLTDVLTSQGKTREVLVPIEMQQFICNGETYLISNQPQVAFVFTNTGTNKVLIEGQTVIMLEMSCSRCLQTVKVPMEIRFTHEVISPDAVTAFEEDRIQFVEGYQLNVEELMHHEIIINLPVKVLCKEDCQGICRECGHDLNEGKCGCDTFVPDPRMAAIKDIFNAHKEV